MTPAATDSSNRGLGAAVTSAGAAVLAAAAGACCVPVLAPLLVSVLGVSGAVWAASLEPYGGVILTGAGAALAYGFWTVYRPRPAADGATCPTTRSRYVPIILWTAATFWLTALVLNLGRML